MSNLRGRNFSCRSIESAIWDGPERVGAIVDELSRASPEIERLWRDNEVVAHGEGSRRVDHPALGLLEREFSAFAVDGRPGLGMIVYNPADDDTAPRIRRHLGRRPTPVDRP